MHKLLKLLTVVSFININKRKEKTKKKLKKTNNIIKDFTFRE